MMNRVSIMVCALFAVSIVSADDGWIATSGSPTYMKSNHPTIRMVSEVITINIGREKTTVFCRFEFRNEGPATTVEMGFPDETNRESNDDLRPELKQFKTWVGGKLTPTRFITTNDYSCFHVKTVRFGKNQSRIIRDQYTVTTGAGAQGGEWYNRYAGYSLASGANWKGPIGSVDIQVHFAKGWLKPTKVARLSDLESAQRQAVGGSDMLYTKTITAAMTRNLKTVFWTGFVTPRLHNGSLYFFAKNLNPINSDNIFLSFAPTKHLANGMN